MTSYVAAKELRLLDLRTECLLNGGDVIKKLDNRLECPKCHTIYPTLTQNVTLDTLIHCSNCGTPLGTWRELEADFYTQGGSNGVFEIREGQITKIDD
jgi:hypothetical protein